MSSIAIPRLPSTDTGGRRAKRQLQPLAPPVRLVSPPSRISAPQRSTSRVAATASAWRRFGIVCAVVVLAIALGVASVARSSQANAFHAQTDGYVMLEPGRSMWGVAVDTVPVGVDVSDHYAALVALNGAVDRGGDGWRVVHLPRNP